MWWSAILYFTLIGIYSVKSELTPPYFNLATGRKIYATATCGVNSDGPELYCKLVGANTEHDNQYFSVIQGQVCDVCDPTRFDKSHPPEYAIDGKESWWQSPPLSRGMKYNEVNLTIDFGQEFHVAYLYIRMGNSPRPGVWTLEKSSDYGKTWKSWQHFSDTPTDCEIFFGKQSLKPIEKDDDVICTTEYSKIVPLENGEIPVMLLNNRPSANNYFNSTILQEWTRATNVRIRLLRTKTLLGHLMSVARQDPTVTRRYFYSIKDISIGGRCMCNGHADTCDVLDPKSERRLLACRCQHRTCGIQCNECCSGFEQKKWRQNTNARPFQCEPCNCFGHSKHCIYDEDIDKKRLSLDIHGNYEGGGICQNCQHNTEGINCNKCKDKFYRPYKKHWNETDVCAPCNCDFFYSTGNCEEETGICECREEFQSPNCDSCAFGYFGYPNCRECECYLNGTEGYFCEAVNGKCPCKPNFNGHLCKECAEEFFGFPECKNCDCNTLGSVDNNCDFVTGQCTCRANYGGVKCERCKDGFSSYPKCNYCQCDNHGTIPNICDKDSGKCLCREGYGGSRCDRCIPGYYNYPDCVPCNCSLIGSVSPTCDISGKCSCLRNFAGKQCTLCSAGYYSYPECLPCNCETHGSEGISCNSAGQCTCLRNFDGVNCDKCGEGFYNFPTCEECNCDPAGVISQFGGCGSVPAGELCQCKERVSGRICDQCKPLFWNLSMNNPEGCEACDCFLDGTIGSLDTCNSKTGQCICKPSVQSRQCKECKDGTFDLFAGNLFGCKDCACDIGGSRNPVCNKLTGQCSCHPRISGRSCATPLTTHYFPTLYQFQHEYEDGYAPSGAFVRYQFDDDQFTNFSGKGYAVFSSIQNEVINEVNIFKSSVYRMVIRYVNPSDENIIASILFTSDNPSELDQSTKVLFKPTIIPSFITVSGGKSEIPSAIVLDPGRYTISTKTDKNVLLDYFVLLPAAYYEASILSRHITNPCELGNLELCRAYRYPVLDDFGPSTEALIRDEEAFKPAVEFYDDAEHLTIIDHPNSIPVITDTQKSLFFEPEIQNIGRYIVVIDYITDREIPETFFLQVRKEGDTDYGFSTMYPCLYTTPCRQPVVDSDSREKIFFFDTLHPRPIEVYHEHDDSGKIAILSVAAIPVDRWAIDFIEPQPVCIMKDGSCIQSSYRIVPDSKKAQFKSNFDEFPSYTLPSYVLQYGPKNISFLNKEAPPVNVSAQVSNPGQYVILMKYYQPNHPRFEVLYRLEAAPENVYEGKLNIEHCPSSIGCRILVKPQFSNLSFEIQDKFTFSITNTRRHGLWIDYILIVPQEEYNANLLEEEKFDQTKEFIQNCSQNNFYIQLNTTNFCRKAVFSLTADYNNGALPCNCDYDGSTSFECDPFGGQCPCKPNVIGRQCDSCRTGFYGFPDCRHCECPSTALCQKDTGECICPPHVTGDKCERCEPYTYGFHQIIGCEECGCNSLGVQNGNLQCDINNGTCICRDNIEGRTCDQCVNGYYSFPQCKPCKCNAAGTTYEICDKITEVCFCKKNVVGAQCEYCSEGAYDLQASNPEGCTKCFCFGKTNRCESAYLRVFNISILRNTTINTVFFANDTIDFQQWTVPLEEVMLNETTIQANFSLRPNEMGIVYFGMLHYFGNQHNHLTSYGGILSYNLYYTTEERGTAVPAPDVILHSENSILIHQSYEQPASAQTFRGIVKIIESSFQTIDGSPVSRGEFMMVLRNLKAIYIRALYWNPSIVTLLSDVYLSVADEDEENYGLYEVLPVEKCYCPPGYTGLSCEDCAPGYYRDPDGPFGGYCIQCQCNGHADTCDCNTGICENCKHFTTGPHCETCIAGYHGNATFGTPNDCMICACPLPYDSNNFAHSCEISETGNEIHCECKSGYIGARCESCAPGFYGQPEKINDFCKPCECSGNINILEPDSCDTVTGECLKCLNNTHGMACNLCAPGFFGDAVDRKDCRSCDCELLGTDYCDSHIGTCVCHENVVGDRCDRCEEDNYGYDSGMGCKACNCAIASNSTQCNEHSGECYCQRGVTGRQCDRCGVDYWNYTADGCTPCSCNKGYSRGFGCNTQTGQCECLPGVIGDKCDACPNRWALLKDQGCIECDKCIHALLDETDILNAKITPVFNEFQTVALSYFTAQKLNYFNNLVDENVPKVGSLNPTSVNLTPTRQQVEGLEMDAKGLNQQMNIAAASVKESLDNGNLLRTNSEDALKDIQKIAKDTTNTIKDVQNFENSFDSSANTKAENALTEVKIIFDELSKAFDENEQNNPEQLKNSQNMLETTKQETLAVIQQDEALHMLEEDMTNLNDKLTNLNDWSVVTLARSKEVFQLNEKNKELFSNSKFGIVSNQTKEANENINQAKNLIINGNLTLNAINNNFMALRDGLDDLKDSNENVDKHVLNIEDEYDRLLPEVQKGEDYLSKISDLATNLTDNYSNITSNSEKAIKASTAYSDIADAVINARKLSENAKSSAGNATELGNGIRARAAKSDEASREIFGEAKGSLESVQNDLEPHLNKSGTLVFEIFDTYKDSNNKLEKMNIALEELPQHSNNKVWEEKRSEATEVQKKSNVSLELLKPIVNQVPVGLKLAKHMPKYIDTTQKDIIQTTHQVDKVEALIPRLSALVSRADKKQTQISSLGSDIADRIEKLKNKIEMARTIANNIKLGVTFHPNTVLEVKPPENLSRLATSSKISAYFNTTQPNGFLMYLGNENKTGSHPAKSPDFIALEIENGYPILKIDLGNGPEKLISDKYVADGKWYKVVVDRIGNHVKFEIHDELDDGNEEVHKVEHTLPGTYSVFDVDENSKIFVGGYSDDFMAPEDLRYGSFDGQIENLRINDEDVGLWNFVDGGENMEGAYPRNRLLTEESPVTGYRFNGNGYVILDAKTHHFKTRSTIHFRFKAPQDALDGLIFYAGKGDHFISVELKEGAIYFQYKLGEHKTSIGTNMTFNDDQWHRVEAERDGRKGALKVDGRIYIDIYQEELSQGTENNLLVSDHMYFGGYPGKHNIPEIVSSNFDGCIDEVVISGTPVDLSRNVKAVGIKPGCPEKFSSSVSYKPGEFGYIKKENVTSENDFLINLKFKTRQEEGLIFYSTSQDESSAIALGIKNGELALRSGRTDLITNGNKYNDGEWHVVTVTRNRNALELAVDDVDKYRSDDMSPNPLVIAGNIYFGGLPRGYNLANNDLPTLAYFVGCISDVTLNGEIINFANSTDKASANVNGCPPEILDYDVSSTRIHYINGNRDEKMEQTFIEEDSADVVHIDHIDATVTEEGIVNQGIVNQGIVNQGIVSHGIEPTSATTAPAPPVTHRTPWKTNSATKQEPACKLPFAPNINDVDINKYGYRLGTVANSRIELKQMPNKMKKAYDISMEFKTDSYDGLLFYAADPSHTDFVALYIKGGKLHHVFRIGQNSANISSDFYYNDDKWHEVRITRQQLKGELIVDKDDINQSELNAPTKIMTVQVPFYIGDVNEPMSHDLNLNLEFEKSAHLTGCIRAIKMQSRLIPLNYFNPVGVIPCSEDVEKGVYFNKGYVKLRERFNVGAEFTVSFDIRPRSTTGMLLSVHGRSSYLILQMLNGTIDFTVDNGEGPIVATFKPNVGENLCDGNWRTVEAIKSKYVITLIVNSVSSMPAIGSATHPITETTRPLFLGGHPHLMKVRGLKARRPYVGCIRNLKIREQAETIRPQMTFGDVQVGVCPIN